MKLTILLIGEGLFAACCVWDWWLIRVHRREMRSCSANMLALCNRAEEIADAIEGRWSPPTDGFTPKPKETR